MKPKTHLPTTTTTTTNTAATGAAAHNGNGSESSSSPSPPPSPRRHSNISYFRRPHRSKSRRDTSFVGALLRRSLRYFLLLLMLYFSGVIMCACPFPAIMGFYPPPPGSVYRSPQIFEKLWGDIRSDNSSPTQFSSVWRYRKRRLKDEKPCTNTTAGWHIDSRAPSGYLIVEANGGLNQQRSSICNAVAVAVLLNAVLVIPHFEFNSIWRDPSKFGDIYDEEHFITTLEGYVNIVRELPETVMERYDHNISNIPNLRVPAWASFGYYLEEVYPILHKQGTIRIAPFANRLAMFVPPHIQFLRCLANFKALKFSFPISTLAKKIVNRMILNSSKTGGKYAAIHLRFEEDMVAFSCCVYDGGETEIFEMDSVREKGWKGKFKRKDRVIRPGLNRIDGKCPLTPVEVGMMLRGMGFDNNTSIYLASGRIYHAEIHLAPLRKMFPLIFTKESLTSTYELAHFEGHSSRLAALDYAVCLFSEVFVTTQGGNFPHFLMGHRRFLYGGHAKTIKPNKRKLVALLQDVGISWKDFKDQMAPMLIESDREGMMTPRMRKVSKKTSIYTYPFPECKCLQESQNSTLKMTYNFHMHDQQNKSLT
ncbi:O-fucosyltransferase 10-like isoform X1 [Malania oleifera]|uniref:O-fucosyltransferase 10-like isoform X1 n=1 Tax=Malania oleifera TaxID=397392 RepID=UPI0025AECB58|nr:O-fucosyltransferase 10-like isoform X1 [Malania oleifera]